VLLATALALGAAVLHATWNLIVKQSGNRQMALWGQFTIAGSMCAVVLVVWSIVDSPPDVAWPWAITSGAMHVPYLMTLARAYNRGDFSMSYPIARGAGALAATIGGIVLLDDSLSLVSFVGVLITVAGLMVLASSGSRHSILPALAVSVTIGIYSVIDAHGARESNAIAYSMALLTSTAVMVSLWALVTNRREMLPTLKMHGKILAFSGTASAVAYGMVLVALQYAPVGYVTALRESSVVIAAFAGWKMLNEGDHRIRLTSAALVFVGLAALVAGG
jgi:multidrug transporter EmrE-like cation transporter